MKTAVMAAAAAMAAMAGAAQAAVVTMDFEDVAPAGGYLNGAAGAVLHEEDGYVATTVGGTVYLDDAGLYNAHFDTDYVYVGANGAVAVTAADGAAFDLASFDAAAETLGGAFGLQVSFVLTDGTVSTRAFVVSAAETFALGLVGVVSATFLSTSGTGAIDALAFCTVDAAPVPLPAAAWLFASGAGVLAARRGRKA